LPKSKGRKQKGAQQQAQALRQKPSTRQLLLQILATGWGKFLAVYVAFATFATVIGGVFFFLDLYRDTLPIVEVEGSDESSPFAFPFKISNRSSVFSMRNAEFFCGIDEVRTRQGGKFSQFSVVDSRRATITQKGSDDFHCILGSEVFPLSPNAIISAHIFVRVKYNTLWVRRVSPETEFTWFTGASAPRWISGKIVE